MDLERICEHVLAYVEFTLESNTAEARQPFVEAIQRVPEFMDCLRVSGEVDYICFSCFSDTLSLNRHCDELGSKSQLGIKNITIRPIMERAKWCLGYPLEKLKWIDE